MLCRQQHCAHCVEIAVMDRLHFVDCSEELACSAWILRQMPQHLLMKQQQTQICLTVAQTREILGIVKMFAAQKPIETTPACNPETHDLASVPELACS